MSDDSRLLNSIEQSDAHAAGQLLPLVYEELRRLAAAKWRKKLESGKAAAKQA